MCVLIQPFPSLTCLFMSRCVCTCVMACNVTGQEGKREKKRRTG
ncbi:Uncharacterized protein APZ42_020890 [Daphnia magna]|uniref:Uncharacterized protein n=1 Tax=Daphnia magna TaxID=35525 RepID=A0A164X554_9CRUS|nr:Uncharacterized protein APZ42_020890 [Daphnia magna]